MENFAITRVLIFYLTMVAHDEYQQLFCMQQETFSYTKRLVSKFDAILIFRVGINLYFTFFLNIMFTYN